jgi:hypothetical protein
MVKFPWTIIKREIDKQKKEQLFITFMNARLREVHLAISPSIKQEINNPNKSIYELSLINKLLSTHAGIIREGKKNKYNITLHKDALCHIYVTRLQVILTDIEKEKGIEFNVKVGL